MADTTDDLSTPLGQNSAPKRRLRLPFMLPQAAGFLLGSILVVFLGFVFFNHHPLGGEPVARVAIRQTSVGDNKPAAIRPAPQQPDSAAAVAARSATGQKTITIIDGSSGSRQDVVVSGPDSNVAVPAHRRWRRICWRSRVME